MRLVFDTVLDDGREEEVTEIEPREGAERSFETVRTAGPVYDLMPDGTLRLASPHDVTDAETEEFGTNVEIIED